MNRLRLWLETRLPAWFQHVEQTERIDIAGVKLTLQDWRGSSVLAIVPKEILDDEYRLSRIQFRPGDVVVDVGANIGIVALYLAKKHPDVRIIAIEPVPTTYRHLKQNIRLNAVSNVTALNCAITRDGRDLRMIVNPAHSGGSTGYLRHIEQPGHYTISVPSRSLDSIFDQFVPDRCRLLKVDCEGAEYEILAGAQCLGRVDYLGMELHTNQFLTSQGCSPESLLHDVSLVIPPEHIAWRTTPMFDH